MTKHLFALTFAATLLLAGCSMYKMEIQQGNYITNEELAMVKTGMSQAQAAKLFGVTQPRVSDLMRGKIELFSLDTLVNMATAAGLHIEMRVLETT